MALGLDLETKGIGDSAIWAWMVLEVVVAGQTVTALERGRALETSNVLLLELERVPERGEGVLSLFFFVHQFITWCSIAVCGRLSTTSSLYF